MRFVIAVCEKQAKTTKKQQLPNTLKEAIEALDEHWVYDAVQLFNNSAVALQRIERLLTRLARKPEWLVGSEPGIMKEISEFVLFIREWDRLARKRIAPLLCTDEIESCLEDLLKAINMPVREKRRLRRHWSTEDDCSSLEPPIVTSARRSRQW